jgi:phosphohistidine phosphatase
LEKNVEIYLIRHAEAVPIGEQGITTDEERTLTEKGEHQTELAAKALQSRGIALDRLFTSPLVRARETADVLLRVWTKPELILGTCDQLAPGGKRRKLSKFIAKSGGERVGLVGHMPDLGDYAAWLLGNKRAQIEMAKAGVALVTCSEFPAKGAGVLQWIVTPEWY